MASATPRIVPLTISGGSYAPIDAAPANAKRLSCKTPCAVTGQCENCQSPGRICCTYVLHRYQRVPGRIKVILVGQELGY